MKNMYIVVQNSIIAYCNLRLFMILQQFALFLSQFYLRSAKLNCISDYTQKCCDKHKGNGCIKVTKLYIISLCIIVFFLICLYLEIYYSIRSRLIKLMRVRTLCMFLFKNTNLMCIR